eukprot:TRINITY_DN5670_c0_g1_i1.p1 TRINITY_DN5670_c0_g1~~TRINITY_DN5670_c0_g1_i1.p1  ORF type:complete len:268 (+),score=77.03 TRINITY_DN5670_c0_g1_i1:73-876(+)
MDATMPSDLEELELYLEDFDIEVERRCEMLRTQLKAQKAAIMKAFSVQFLKIPKKYKTMSVAEYRTLTQSGDENSSTTFSKSREELMGPIIAPPSTRTRGAAKRRVAADSTNMPPPATATRGKKAKATSKGPSTARKLRSTRKGQQSDFETPMPGTASSARIKATPAIDPRLPRTPMIRQPKQGECMLSENGSPIALDTGGVRVRSTRGRSTIITVPLDNGKAVELNPEDLKKQNVKKVLNKKEKREALKHLEALQDQVASLMQQLQ